MIIGRTDENDIVINHRSISRNHAKIARDPETQRYTISDLQSSNGVRVNKGQDYGKVELRRGDVVDLGHVRLRFVEPGEDFVFARDAVITDVPESGGKRGMLVAVVLGVVVLGAAAAFLVMHSTRRRRSTSRRRLRRRRADPRRAPTWMRRANDASAPTRVGWRVVATIDRARGARAGDDATITAARVRDCLRRVAEPRWDEASPARTQKLRSSIRRPPAEVLDDANAEEAGGAAARCSRWSRRTSCRPRRSSTDPRASV